MELPTRVDGVRGDKDDAVEVGLDVKPNSGTGETRCEWTRAGATRDMMAS
jgi:hypothetical protein